jgi:hypothetical protein
MDKIFTKEKMIDLYLTAPVIKITLSSKRRPLSSRNINKSCVKDPHEHEHEHEQEHEHEPSAKKTFRQMEDMEEEDIMSDENIYIDEKLDSVLSRETPILSQEKSGLYLNTPIRKGAYGMDIKLVSPFTQTILSNLSDEDAKKYLKDYLRENEILKKIQEKIDENDPEFKFTSPSQVGIVLEYWVCAHIKCPVCDGELHKYSFNNMPVIDVRCSNEKHTFNSGPKYFQIKVSEENAALLYFTLNRFLDHMNGFITVGSERLGKFSHKVTPGGVMNKRNDDDKRLLIGYICITYTYISTNNRYIKVNLHKSFILLPSTTINEKSINMINDYYYKYINTITNKPTIVYNPEFVDMIRFESFAPESFKENVFNSNKQIIINLDTEYDEIAQIPENIQRAVPAAAAAAGPADDPDDDPDEDMPDQPDFDSELALKLKYLILKDIK